MKKLLLIGLLLLMSNTVYAFGDSSSSSSINIETEDKTIIKSKFAELGDLLVNCGYVDNTIRIFVDSNRLPNGLIENDIKVVTKYRLFKVYSISKEKIERKQALKILKDQCK